MRSCKKLSCSPSAAKNATSDTRIRIYPVPTHTFHIFWTFLPEAMDALGEVGRFIRGPNRHPRRRRLRPGLTEPADPPVSMALARARLGKCRQPAPVRHELNAALRAPAGVSTNEATRCCITVPAPGLRLRPGTTSRPRRSFRPGSSRAVRARENLLGGAAGRSRGAQGRPRLKKGLEAGQNGGPPFGDGRQHYAARREPVCVTVSLTTPWPTSSMSKATLERASAQQAAAVASSMPTAAAHSGVIVCQV